jgi:hypothetical protein
MSWLIRDVLIEAEQRSKADAPSAYSQDSAVALSSASKNRSRQASRVSTNLGIRSPIFRVLRRPALEAAREIRAARISERDEERPRLSMTAWDPDDREKTAYHEAGHAIVLWTFGVLPTGGVHLDQEEESGRTATDLSAPTRLRPVQQIATSLAGFEAEQAFRPPGRKAKAMIDCGEVRRILRENGTSIEEPEGQALRDDGRTCAQERLRAAPGPCRAVEDEPAHASRRC